MKNYDYSQTGAYFITLCTQGRECLLGNVENSAMQLSQYGVIVEQIWSQIPHHFQSVTLDAAVVMPNHFHGIILVSHEQICPNKSVSTETYTTNINRPTLGQIIAYFKYQSTKLINAMRDMTGIKFWQRNYYEHIIRSEKSLAQLRTYIEQNPQKWQHDQLHPENPSKW